ncbi:MAG: UbiX family flavin prenyltransferase [Planctomycetota bacterium]
MHEQSHTRFVVGITGASGAAYSQRLITELVALGHETHVVITRYGKRLLHDELGLEAVSAKPGAGLHALAGLPESADPRDHGLYLHPAADVGASLGSGSFRHHGMAIVPCSSNTLGAIASGYGDELLTRAAAVCLKERFPLVIVHREAPLNRVDLRNMLELHDAGAVICPANPGFYLQPTSIEEIVDFVVARILDCLGVEHTVSRRWDQHLADSKPPASP